MTTSPDYRDLCARFITAYLGTSDVIHHIYIKVILNAHYKYGWSSESATSQLIMEAWSNLAFVTVDVPGLYTDRRRISVPSLVRLCDWLGRRTSPTSSPRHTSLLSR